MDRNRLAVRITLKGKRFIVFLVLFFAFVFRCYNQNYLVHHYSGSDGLPSTTVRDIAQDHAGRIWFATRAGISCYDGLTWKNYALSEDLPVHSFFAIAVDRQNRIFALADDGYSISVFYHQGNLDAPWKHIEIQRIGNAGLMEMTSLRLVEQGDFPVVAVGTARHGLFIRKDNRWNNITEKNGLLSSTINGMIYLGDKLFVATEEGLSVIKIGKTISIDNSLHREIAFPSKEIKGISIEEKGKYPDCRLKNTKIWVCGLRWIGYFEENHTQLTVYQAKYLTWEKMKKICLQPDYRCGVYLGQMQRLQYFNINAGSLEHTGTDKGLISDGANALFIDFEKNVWVACDRGVSKITGRIFSNLQKIHGLLEDEVTAVLEYKPGKFALGHNTGITFYDGKDFSSIRLPHEERFRIPVCRALDMQSDSKLNVWAALAWAGLAKIDTRQRVTRYGPKDGLPENIICLWVDNKDNVWLGTQFGIYYHQPGKGFELRNPGKYGKVSARRLYGSRGQLRYIASHNSGLYVHRANRWQNYRVPGNENVNNVFSVKKDSRGRLFVGTMAGLYILDREKLKKFKAGDFYVDRPVYFILEDGRNRLWFGTNKGVIRWDGKKKKQYSVAEGLSGQETNRAAGLVDSKGRVWIGTNHGLSIYNEEFDDGETFQPAPKIQLLYVDVFDKKIPLTETNPIRLTATENTIEFFFRGISFIDEKKLYFKSKLAGFDKEWSPEKYFSNQVIRYTSLPAGNYRVFLKARNSQGIWSEVISSPAIYIPEPFYRQWWFYLSAFLAIGFLFYGVFRFFSQKRNTALLERKVKERTSQLQKMQQQLIQSRKMEAVGTLAGGIAHDFNNILGIIAGNSEIILDDLQKGTPAHESAETILSAAERAAGLVRQILTFSRQSSQKRQPLKLSVILEEALKLLRASLPASIEIKQHIHSEENFVMADHVQVNQVIMNLGANAAHAMRERGGVLEVSLDKIHLDAEEANKYNDLKPGSYLRLTVSDTGQGMTNQVKKRIFEPFFTTKKTGEGTGMGLSVVHGIVKGHGGDITVHSEPNRGTTFHILLPQIEETGKPKAPVSEELPSGSEEILLVDDEAALAYVEKEILDRLGYKVTGKSNAVEALETFRSEPGRFDLLITDLTMPQMTGIQLAEEVRRIRSDIPIIFCSGFSAAITRDQIKGFANGSFVMKPVNKRYLAKLVREVLDKP